MKIEYEYSEEDNLVFVNPVGIVDIKSFKEILINILNSDNIRQGYIDVVNFEKVDDFTINLHDCIELTKIFKKLKEKKHYRGAVVYAKDDTVLFMAKILSAVLGTVGITDIKIINNNDKNTIHSVVKEMRS